MPKLTRTTWRGNQTYEYEPLKLSIEKSGFDALPWDLWFVTHRPSPVASFRTLSEVREFIDQMEIVIKEQAQTLATRAIRGALDNS